MFRKHHKQLVNIVGVDWTYLENSSTEKTPLNLAVPQIILPIHSPFQLGETVTVIVRPMGSPRTIEEREVALYLTRRYAGMMVRLLRRERRRCELSRAKTPDFVPEPGRFDINLMRMKVFDEIRAQIESQLPHLENAK